MGGSSFNLTPYSDVYNPLLPSGTNNLPTAGIAAGRFGNAASFTRASSQYAFTGGDVIAAANTDFSYSAWYNFGVANITNTTDRYFVLETTVGDVPSSTEVVTASIGLRDLVSTTTPDDVQVFGQREAPLGNITIGSTALTANVWQNVIVTYDADGGSVQDGIYRAFLNGVEFAFQENVTSRAVGGLVIGGHRAGTGRNFQGLIDEVAFFDTVLTSNQISNLQTMTALQVIPEPSSAIILAGIGCVLGVARRRRSK